jgi:serine/threonine protein kinase
MEAGPPAPAPAAADASVLPAGYRINEYEIERTLGGGGFGVTYLARDSNLNLPVAIKEYFPNELATRGPNHTVLVRATQGDAKNETYTWGLERFLDEARALATFRHPNIVRVLRYFRDNGTAYIVMEYESGLSLKRWVPQNAPLSQRSVLSILYPLLDGLEQVHKSGFLHRDIKPDNIYVRADGSPVLLDFGSARRVSTQQELTNIVSPGFAPFEQYHSHGNQGPWTDIYSIGAVMYWMVTGKKPMESASRVKTDSMMPASSLAEASVFGESLLQAIEWAMTSDEAKRPQTVGQLRSAIFGSAERMPGDATRSVLSPSDRTAILAAGNAPSVPGAPSAPSGTSQKRNLLGTILFLDLVGYSIKSVDNQVALKKLFNELIGKALRGVPEETRIAIDTGDGAAICFMGDPEEALHSALLLRDLLGQRYGNVLTARIGLHMGPVRVISDINNRVNVIGDGINVAQRVMDFAQPNQVLVSRAYYDVISRITDDTAEMFMYLGQHEDKHGRMHEVYSVEQSHKTTTRREGPSTGYTQTMPVRSVPLSDEMVHDVEAELARHIGPLAKVLVRKARPLALTIDQLRDALAPSIQEPKAREQFLAAEHAHPSSHPPSSHPPSGAPSSASMPLSQPSRPRGAPSAPVRSSPPSGGWPAAGNSIPASTRANTQPASTTLRSQPSGRTLDIPPDELTAIEHALSKHIGPMAKMLVKREYARSSDVKSFVEAIAANVDKADQREAFMETLRRTLHKRSF